MAVSLVHTTQAPAQDAGNGPIGSSQWNEEHTLTLGTGKLLGRTTAGTGAAEEISAGTGLTLSSGSLSVTAGTYAAASHSHAIADVTGLQTELDGKQASDADLTAIAALAGTSGFLKKTAANTWSLDTSTYLTGAAGSTTQLQYNNAGAFAGASGITTNGTELTIASGTKTADAPLLNATQTWNNSGVTFTGMKLNVTDTASAAASSLVDLQVGGTSQFNLTKSGNATITGGWFISGQTDTKLIIGTGTAASNASIRWKTGNILTVATGDNSAYVPIEAKDFRIGAYARILNPDAVNGRIRFTNWLDTAYAELQFGSLSFQTDLFLTRRGAANLRFGAADAAAPVAQTLSVQSVVAGTSNTAGANLTIAGSQGTGTGAGGSIIFQTAPAGTTGTSQNALATALTISGAGNVSIGNAAIATDATNGFLYVPSCAGTPTGTPTTITGRVPIVVDTTNNKLYFYSGAAWRDAGP